MTARLSLNLRDRQDRASARQTAAIPGGLVLCLPLGQIDVHAAGTAAE